MRGSSVRFESAGCILSINKLVVGKTDRERDLYFSDRKLLDSNWNPTRSYRYRSDISCT
jgi:hypothetical protein